MATMKFFMPYHCLYIKIERSNIYIIYHNSKQSTSSSKTFSFFGKNCQIFGVSNYWATIWHCKNFILIKSFRAAITTKLCFKKYKN